MKILPGLVYFGAGVFLFTQACGSEDGAKKNQPDRNYPGSGGDGMGGDGDVGGTFGNGDPEGGGGTRDPEGNGGNGIAGAISDGGTTGDGGTTMSRAGSMSLGGSGGAEPVDACEAGYDDCDGDMENGCEQNINLITACGDCTTKCNATNGVPTCVEGSCEFTCSDGFADCDGEGENGCEVALATDAANCGSCGRNCETHGATCAAQVCSTVPLQQDFSSDAWGTWDFGALGVIHTSSGPPYSVRRFTLDTPGVLTVWAPTNKISPRNGTLVVGSDVYWSERGDGTKKFTSVVYKKSLTAAAAELPTPVFSPEFAATFLRKQGNALYWASGGYQEEGGITGGGGFIYTRAIDAEESDPGTRIVTVDQGNWDNIRGLAVTTNALYWVTSLAGTGTAYELRTAPLSGSPISVVPAVFSNASLAVAVYPFDYKVNLVPRGEYVYFTRITGDAQDGVYRFKTGLAKPERLVLASYATSLAVDDDYVYFVQHSVQGAWRAPINGGVGGAAEKIADGYVSRVLGVDDTFVYASNGDGTGNTDLFKVIK